MGVPSLLLAAWLGAALLFAVAVAPAAFAVLPSRSLAGELVGRVLPIVFITGMIVAVVSLALDRSSVGRLLNARRLALVLVVVACAAAQFVVSPRIERIRRDIPGTIEQLATDDSRRVAFGRLHAISVAWLGVAMIAATATIVLASLKPRVPSAADAAIPAAARR